MHDTKGVVYLANGSGNVWMEFSNDGSIDIYAKEGINIRSGGDMNFHSEKDINMYANKNFKIKANQSEGKVSIDGADIQPRHTQGRGLQRQTVGGIALAAPAQ